jgi:hypothetical protein
MYAPLEVHQAKTAVRIFLAKNPRLHPALSPAYLTGDPKAAVSAALQQDQNSSQLCDLISSPVGQLALQTLLIEMPQWRLVIELLPVAAQGLCQDRRQGASQTGFGAALMVAGLGLLVYALKRAA